MTTTLLHFHAISEQRPGVPGRSLRTVRSSTVLRPPVSKDLVVVGAGIVGASVAYHAARAGAVATLVDADRRGPA